MSDKPSADVLLDRLANAIVGVTTRDADGHERDFSRDCDPDSYESPSAFRTWLLDVLNDETLTTSFASRIPETNA